MSFKGALAGSASILAIVAAAAPAIAQTSTSNANNGGIEEVTVTGIRASNQRAIDIKRNSTAIVDAVSAEDIGKFPDKNVADALQRVPGVTTFSQSSGEGGFAENDRIGVRGTNPSLTNTMVDGHAVATGDWFILDQFQTVGRSVSFSLFPSEIVSNVKVYKSQEADLVEGGVAGSVDIITHKPLDFDKEFTLQASAQAYYSDLAQKTDPQINGMASWHNDSDTFGILVQGFYEKSHLRRDGQEFLGYNAVGAGDAALCGHSGRRTLYPTLIGSALFEQTRKREGGSVAMQWRPNNQLDFSVSGFYSHMDADNINNNFMAWLTNEIPHNVPTSFTIKKNTLVQASFPLLNPGGTPVDGVVEDSIYRPGAAAETWYIDGDVNWTPTARWNIHAKLGYTRGEGLTPSQPTWESDAPTGVDFNFANGGPASVSFPNIDTTNPGDMTNDWAWSDKFTAVDKEFYTQADVEYELNSGPWQSIKFGGRIADHTRDVVGYDRGTSFPLSSSAVAGGQYPGNFAGTFAGPGFLKDIWLPDWNKIQNIVMPAVTPYVGPAGNFFYWPGSFQTVEHDWAAYAMANLQGDRWKGNFGLRFVHTGEDVTSYVTDATGIVDAYGNYDADKIKHTYTDPLPSANFSYDLSDDQVLRLAAARTISRPDYSALGGSVSLNDTIHTGTLATDLKPVRSWNYDASYEWYFGDASLLSVSLFYMDLTSYVTFGTHSATYLDATSSGQAGTPIFASYDITSPTNTSGTDKRIEASWQQPIWGGFGVQTNFTYADGEEDHGGGPLVGDAKETYNLTGYYENSWLSARLAYTWRSHVLIGLDRSTAENQQSIGDLDASINYNVTDNVAITLDGRNLTNETLKYYANNTSQPRAFYSNGRQYFIGLRFNN